jgi:mRNA interferase MazF
MTSARQAPPLLRGDVWLVAFGAGRPGEPTKNRPAVIITADTLNALGSELLVSVVPLSSTLTSSPLRPVIHVDEGVKRPSAAICAATAGVARSRLLQRFGTLRPQTLEDITASLAVIYDIRGRTLALGSSPG